MFFNDFRCQVSLFHGFTALWKSFLRFAIKIPQMAKNDVIFQPQTPIMSHHVSLLHISVIFVSTVTSTPSVSRDELILNSRLVAVLFQLGTRCLCLLSRRGFLIEPSSVDNQ